MECHDVLPVIRAFVDRELDPSEVEWVEAHLGGCSDCSERVAAERELKLAIRARSRVGPAPAGLATEIKRAVHAEAGPRARRSRGWRLLVDRRILAAGFMAALVIATLASIWSSFPPRRSSSDRPRSPSRLTVELVDDHIRYRGADQPLQITTSNPAEAERWFASRLAIAVDLPSFEEPSVELQGGRLCYLLDRRVALLFYACGQQQLSLFVMNASGLDFDGMTVTDLASPECVTDSHKGYQVVGWKKDGLLFALVADEGEEKLEALLTAALQGQRGR